MQKRKSEVIQSRATGGVETMFAALADEDLHGGSLEGDFDISQLSEEHQAQLMMARSATESSTEVMRKKKEAEIRQREQEKRWQEERRMQELKEWALSFGSDGDDAARKIQVWWRGGSAKLLAHKAREQVEIETWTDVGHGKGGKSSTGFKKQKSDGKISKELKEWEESMDPKELNDAAQKVQAAHRSKRMKKGAGGDDTPGSQSTHSVRGGKKKIAFEHEKAEGKPSTPQAKAADQVDPNEFDSAECEAAAVKLQAMQKGKMARRDMAKKKAAKK